jgi:hypothetical protein
MGITISCALLREQKGFCDHRSGDLEAAGPLHRCELRDTTVLRSPSTQEQCNGPVSDLHHPLSHSGAIHPSLRSRRFHFTVALNLVVFELSPFHSEFLFNAFVTTPRFLHQLHPDNVLVHVHR